MLKEIIRSCGNASVAEAAVRSIGVSFAQSVEGAARSRGLRLGQYVSGAVRSFDREAPPEAREALLKAIRRTDQPILAGLRFILDRSLEDEPEDGWKARGVGGRKRAMLANCCYMA